MSVVPHPGVADTDATLGPGGIRVLLVEDDDGIAEPLEQGLTREGFEVSRVATGAQALSAPPPDVVLLDLGLPDIDGYAVCQQMRARSVVPILVLTARGAEMDRVVGLELGADDYLVKPFGFRELVARMRAVMRRRSEPAAAEPVQELGALTVDRRARRVLVEGREVALSPKEFDLLALLADDPGAVVSRQTILEEVWDPHWYGPTKTVDVHVATLRRKLGCPDWILTVRRVGLRLGDTSSPGPNSSTRVTLAADDTNQADAMTRRLVLSYLGLAFLILVLLEIPMAILAARHEHGLTAGQAAQEANGLAAVANEDMEHGHLADLTAIVAQYQSRTGEEVAIIDPAGTVIASSDRDQDNDAAGTQRSLVQAALSGRSVTSFSSDEGQPWAYAAVPISADNQPQGAILLGVAASATEGRIHAIWLALGGFAAGILALTGLVGVLLARSLSRPLARLESAVTRLGEGNLATRADADIGPPEMRTLARQFNHMAGRLSELVDAQSRFVADASHQLRSPLTALRLRLENLEVSATVPSSEEVAAAGREVQRLSRLVDGLLTLGRAENIKPPRRIIDVEKVIEERADAWSALADERHVTLVAPYDDHVTRAAWLAPGDLDQILDNLLANALDASPEGGQIRVELIGTAPGWLEMHVIDQGPGMSEDDRRRAFDRFWQGAGTESGHSGLGLAIVRQLAVRNDASVQLRPAKPNGLDAVLRIPPPTGQKAHTPSQPPASHQQVGTERPAGGGPATPARWRRKPMVKGRSLAHDHARVRVEINSILRAERDTRASIYTDLAAEITTVLTFRCTARGSSMLQVTDESRTRP